MNDSTQKSWWKRLSGGLKRTSSALSGAIVDLVTKRKLDAEAVEELENELIRADLGPEVANRIAAAFAEGRFEKAISPEAVKALLAGEIEKVLTPVAKPLEITAKPFVILVAGVNGSGKTTTIGKLAAMFRHEGKSVMLAAGDTFRAAAIDQLKIWGERTGAKVMARDPGADAAGLAFDALTAAKTDGTDVVLVDTAGRLQNRVELMSELVKIVRVMRKVEPSAPHAVLLVLDATVGQNALNQVEIFGKIAGVTGLVMTKLDGTARGGILVAIASRIPPAGAFRRRRRGRRGSQPLYRARFRTGGSGAGVTVIPGRPPKAVEPGIQSRAPCPHRWIPGSLAEFIIGPRLARTRWLGPRNDKE